MKRALYGAKVRVKTSKREPVYAAKDRQSVWNRIAHMIMTNYYRTMDDVDCLWNVVDGRTAAAAASCCCKCPGINFLMAEGSYAVLSVILRQSRPMTMMTMTRRISMCWILFCAY